MQCVERDDMTSLIRPAISPETMKQESNSEDWACVFNLQS